MIRLIILIAFTYGIAWIPYYFMLDDEFITIYTRDIQYFLMVAYAFYVTNKNKIVLRSILLSWLVFCTVESQQYFILQYFHDIYFNTYLITAGILSLILFYNILKPYKHKNDDIKNIDNIYLCFWRPKNIVSLSGSLLGRPFGGLSIYAGGFLYGFRWNSKQYQKEPIEKEIIARNFVVFDTGILLNEIIHKELTNLVNFAHAGILRIRCIKTITPVLKLMGPKYKPRGLFEYIPSIYSTRIMKR